MNSRESVKSSSINVQEIKSTTDGPTGVPGYGLNYEDRYLGHVELRTDLIFQMTAA